MNPQSQPFIYFLQKLPDQFVQAADSHIPCNVILQILNGRDVHVHYKKQMQCLTSLYPLYTELGEEDFFLFFTYKGMGVFRVEVIDSEDTEIEYRIIRRIPRSPLIFQGILLLVWLQLTYLLSKVQSCFPKQFVYLFSNTDKTWGKRWKFLCYANGSVFDNGSLVSIKVPNQYIYKVLWKWWVNELKHSNCSWFQMHSWVDSGQLSQVRPKSGLSMVNSWTASSTATKESFQVFFP